MSSTVKLFLIAIFAVLSCCNFAVGQSIKFSAVVTKAVDADTVDLVHINGVPDRIRLTGIDAPEVSHSSKEISQPFSETCKKTLQILIDGRTVTIEAKMKRDGYGRLLGRILYGNVDVNLFILQAGCAWLYYPNGIANELRASYLEAFETARANKIGLFKNKSAVTPATWRKKRHFRRVK